MCTYSLDPITLNSTLQDKQKRLFVSHAGSKDEKQKITITTQPPFKNFLNVDFFTSSEFLKIKQPLTRNE